jgi:type II secretory pathway pseudopilin PulG
MLPAGRPEPESRRRLTPDASEHGFTLIETVVLVAILAIMGAVGYGALAQRPAQARSSAVAFAGLVVQARALAAVTDDGVGGASGASIGVVPDGADEVATLYAYRPIRATAQVPVAATNTAALRLPTTLAIMQGTAALRAPFALFFSASGHVSVQPGYRIGTDPPLDEEPVCPIETGITIGFIDGVADRAYPLSCALATFDLDHSRALAVPALAP